MGVVREKAGDFADAAMFYDHAWEFSNSSNHEIGYRLAFNYVKAKRFIEAIAVCHQVLKQNPQYPKIKKDILDKARAGLRM